MGENQYSTIIDGNQNGSVVTFNSGEDSTALLSGFTIQHGYKMSEDFENNCGGGVFIYNSGPSLENLIVKDNQAIQGAGIASLYQSSPTINNLIISDNSGQTGGGIFLYSYENPTPIFSNVLINNNYVTGSGGGIYCMMTNPIFINTTVSNNTADGVNTSGDGGGLNNTYNSSSLIINTIFWGNEPTNIINDASINIQYSNIEGGFEGEGNIDADPQFTDPEKGDYTLQPTSPCIDAGDPASDLDPDGTRADMGAFYFDQIENPIIYGCTDPLASNYDPEALQDDDSCEYAPHFIPETGGYPNGAMGIYITDIDIDPGGGCSESIEPDWWWHIFCDSLAVPWMEQDEIALFDGDICVGSAKNESGADSPTIFVYEDNPNTPEQDGYIAGGELLFKYWHHSTQTELTNLHANYNPDSGIGPTTYYFEPFGALNAEFEVYFLNGCTDVEACNYYDSLVTIDDGSCSTMEELGWCDCEGSIIDECGVCGGSGIPSGECDCDGNELDCEGVCGGGAIIDECGVCNGDGAGIECWDGSFVCDETSCPTPFTGDMNTDGLLNILDVIILLNWILDDEPYIEYGDLNEDGYINIIDVVLLVNWIIDGIPVCEGVEDTDGNCYATIQIGEQLWMTENLKVTHYNNGDEISYPSNEDFGSFDEGQYGVYDNDPSNADIYGNLYNWAVVGDDRGVCPEGFHVPSDYEYTILTDYLGGASVAGGKMKSTGTIEDGDGLWNYWSDEITEEATNESGFTGLPAGHRGYYSGGYGSMGYYGYFWSSSEGNSYYAWTRELGYGGSNVGRSNYYKHYGFSVRCLGD